jgi:hypothetical protein
MVALRDFGQYSIPSARNWLCYSATETGLTCVVHCTHIAYFWNWPSPRRFA